MYKKKENNAFKFLQAIVFINDVHIYKMCTIQWGKKRKKSYELICLFGNVTDQTSVREEIISLGFLSRKKKSVVSALLRTFGSKLNLVWNRSSKMGAALNSSLSLSALQSTST